MADSMDKKYSNVPNLRFSKFSEDYSSCRFVDALTFLNSNSFSRDEMNLDEGNYKNIHYGDILIKFPTLVDSKSTLIPFVNKNVVVTPKMNLLKDGDIVIADTAEDYTTGKAIELVVGKDKILSGLHTIPCRPKFKFSSGYLGYYLNSSSFRKNLLPLIQGIKVYSVSKYMFNSLYIKYPSLEEQQKVSNLLFKIDHRISTQNKIISAKKSLMKNIVVGMKNDSASSVALSSIAEIYQPQTLAQNELIPGDYYVYGANGIIGKHNRYNHENEEICLTCRGSTCGNLCLSKPFSWINGNAMVIKTNNNINKHFIYYALLKINWSKYISGSGQPQIVRSAIQNIRINLPDIEIQNKISIVLDTLNDSIEAELLLLNKLNELKRYLLSNLFI